MKYRRPDVGPFRVARYFQRMKGRFPTWLEAAPDAGPGRDEMERQIAVAFLEDDMGEEAVLHGVAIAGILTALSLGRGPELRWEPFPDPVWDLARRVLRVFHPDYDPSLSALADRFWPTPGDRDVHLALHGAAIRAIFEEIRQERRKGTSYRDRLLGRIDVESVPSRRGFYLNAVVSARDPAAWFAVPEGKAPERPPKPEPSRWALWRRFGGWVRRSRPRTADPPPALSDPRLGETTRVG